MEDWYVTLWYSFFSYGILNTILRICSYKGYPAKKIISLLYLTASIIYLFLFIKNIEINIYNIVFGLTAGLLSAYGTLYMYKSLNQFGSTLTYPIINSSCVFSVIVGLVFLKEKINIYKGIGLIFVFLTFLQINKIKNINFNLINRKKNSLYIAFLFYGLLDVVLKLSTIYSANLISTIFILYLVSSLIFIKDIKIRDFQKDQLKYSIFAGIMSALGTYFYIKSLAQGYLFMIPAFIKLNIILPIIFSILLLKEKINKDKILIILFAVVAIVSLTK